MKNHTEFYLYCNVCLNDGRTLCARECHYYRMLWLIFETLSKYTHNNQSNHHISVQFLHIIFFLSLCVKSSVCFLAHSFVHSSTISTEKMLNIAIVLPFIFPSKCSTQFFSGRLECHL